MNIRIVNTTNFSDEAIMVLHRVFGKARVFRYDEIIAIKEAAYFNILLLRIPMCHKWEIEKTLLDLNIPTSA